VYSTVLGLSHLVKLNNKLESKQAIILHCITCEWGIEWTEKLHSAVLSSASFLRQQCPTLHFRYTPWNNYVYSMFYVNNHCYCHYHHTRICHSMSCYYTTLLFTMHHNQATFYIDSDDIIRTGTVPQRQSVGETI